MKKDKFNSKLREYAKNLSPTSTEQDLIGKVYQSFNDLFGTNNCIQIGSYPRFTAVTPVHDLDVLYIVGAWIENKHDPSMTLQSLYKQIKNQYVSPTNYTHQISLQTHSIAIQFWQNSTMVLSVDIVPAYSYGKNEYNQDKYKVPEVTKEKNHTIRNALTWDASNSHAWIDSDPRGYIKVATELGENPDFRKTVKFIKKWKNNLCDLDHNLKLKSFHLEQVLTKIFQQEQNINIFDAIFQFFCDLPDIIAVPNQIADRANNDKYIDDYVTNFTMKEKDKFKKARDGFLIKLEKFTESSEMSFLMEIEFHERPASEEFMFDKRIKMLIDPNAVFKIDGFVKPLRGFSNGWISKTPQLQKGLTRGLGKSRKIEFSIVKNSTTATSFWWKVRNSDGCGKPRGEITSNQTKNNPETTEYIGDHFVECFATNHDICLAKSRLPVKII